MIVVVVERILEVGGGGGGRGGGGGGGSRLCGGDMQRPGVVGNTCWGERLEGGEHSTPTVPVTPTLQPLGEGRTHVTIHLHYCCLLPLLPPGRPRGGRGERGRGEGGGGGRSGRLIYSPRKRGGRGTLVFGFLYCYLISSRFCFLQGIF